MTKSGNKKPTWSDLKRQLTQLDHSALLGLIHDLYAASSANQAFLNARFALGGDALKPYKATISRWVCPNVLRNQDVSVSKAKKAISEYKKAVGRPEGVAELSVFYVECCAELLGYCGMDDAGYFTALVRTFEQALVEIQKLGPEQQAQFVDRLERVVHEGQDWPWDIGYDIAGLMVEYGFNED